MFYHNKVKTFFKSPSPKKEKKEGRKNNNKKDKQFVYSPIENFVFGQLRIDCPPPKI